MGSTSLHDLIATLAGAITTAQDAVEHHYLSLIRRYFDAEGRPLTLGIQLPATSTHAVEGETKQVVVPVLALVESRALGIASVEVTLDVELTGINQAPSAVAAPAVAASPAGAPLDFLVAEPKPNHAPAAPSPPAAAPAAPQPMMAIRLPGGGGGGPTAKVIVRVEERPASEALTRLVAKLNTLI